MPSDAAAVRAVAKINSRPLTEQVWEDVITEEYRPLVEAARKVVASKWGCSYEPSPELIEEFENALREVVGDKP
jgi:hypothetical protein